MTKWLWQFENWYGFQYDADTLRPFEDQFLHLTGKAVGSLVSLTDEGKTALQIALFEEEAIETSGIEGEVLDRISVQKSLRRHLGLSAASHRSEREIGVAELMTAMCNSFDKPLTDKELCNWHRLVVSGRRDIREVGQYRTDPALMEVVSGPVGRETVHYVAPPSADVPSEMARFVDWFNDAQNKVPAIARAGIAHLWFETIHPFEDGNGRVGRAVAQKALGQAIGSVPIAMLSEIINRTKNRYYDTLNVAQRGGGVDQWLDYFARTVVAAQERTIQRIGFVAAKTRFLDHFSSQLNERQNKAVHRMFEAGPDGFIGGLSAANYRTITGATVPTTTRDLNELVDAGILHKQGELKYSRYYLTYDNFPK